MSNSGIVDEYIDRELIAEYLLHTSGDRIAVREIEVHRLYPNAVFLSELSHIFFKRLAEAPCTRPDISAVFSVFFDNSASYAAVRTGYDSIFSIQHYYSPIEAAMSGSPVSARELSVIPPILSLYSTRL